MRGRVGETYLDEKIPLEIKDLYPSKFPLTHFWVEVEIGDNWRKLDPSYDLMLEKAGFVVNQWESDRTSFDIGKTYTQEEMFAYQSEWNDEAYAKSYFEAVGPCALALNDWFEKTRSPYFRNIFTNLFKGLSMFLF